MRRTSMLWLAAILLAVPASAQTKLSGKVQCAKPDPDYAIEVGDKPGHVMSARKQTCVEDWKIADLAVKTGQDVATGEMNGATGRDNGYHTATMENGDKYVVHFGGTTTAAKDGTATFDGKWSFVSGTGKLKGIKGGGTYKGTGKADGSGEVMVEGDYTLPAPAAPKKK
jgi:hypothetical protein